MFSFIFSTLPSMGGDLSKVPPTANAGETETIIVGGGHLGLIEALLIHLRAKEKGQTVRIIIYEKNASTSETTAANIWNSHTPDEIVSVVPRGKELEEKLQIKFSEPGGIRVEDVSDVNDSDCTKRFIEQVKIYGQNEEGHKKRTDALLALGKAGMLLWKQLFVAADAELKAILEESNFNPCSEFGSGSKPELHKGYRVDLIYDVPNAGERAISMQDSYQKLGYINCRILSPDEVVACDPSLRQFCDSHSTGKPGERQWKQDAVALWRPGGCLDTQTFLPKLVAYLKKSMGDRFQLKFNKKVTEVIYGNQEAGQVKIEGLKFADGLQAEHKGENITYIFCPGESVGTLSYLGFTEPAYAGFAGASLSLNIPASKAKLKKIGAFNHCMEVHKVGVVLAWQGRIRGNKLFLGGAGTKAYYANKEPTIHEAFATDRNRLQLQMFNDVVPWLVSLALKRNTTGQTLTENDMMTLEKAGIAKRWVGRRAVTYDGFPTLGRLYYRDNLVSNGRTTTHLGSGGGSFSLVTSLMSYSSLFPQEGKERLAKVDLSPAFVEEVLSYADSRRQAQVSDS